ncbi:hypothetical protein TYRP_009323 [Tyrophagus putrescentiae]|nr:hypothetical protein TYRP_009323 [Tyrophagus putrescentiae]
MHPTTTTTTTTTASLVATLLSLHLLINSPVQCQQLHPKRELTQPLAVPTAQSPLLQSRRRVVTAEGDGGDGNHQTTLPGAPPSPLPTKDNNCDEDAHHQDFVSDRVKVTLDCKPNLMRLHLNFTEPFRGVVSVGRSSWDELSGGETTAKEAKRCSIRGQGSRRYRLDLDHRSCRTTFDSKRGQFSNTLFVRYHPTLETGGDYSKTLLCKFGLTSFSVH